MTDLDQPLGFRFHFHSASAACEGRAQFHAKHNNTSDQRVWNTLAVLFNEAAELDDFDTPLGRALLASADALLDDGMTAP